MPAYAQVPMPDEPACATLGSGKEVVMVLLEKRSSPYRSPYRDLELLGRQFNWLLEPLSFGPALTPAADVYENGDEIVVELEVPGYDRDELNVEVSDHTVAIS